jgi:murein L,D-transpeptidase YafK
MGRRFWIWWIAIGCAVCFACAKPPVAPPPAPPVPAQPAAPPPCTRVERVEVSKSQRLLTAHCVGGATLEFPIALSREPGAKRTSGDDRMPEGSYRVSGPPRKSRFYLFIPIDYPSPADADVALAEGRIPKDVHDSIVSAHHQGRIPPQDTALGGMLGIHGEGVRWRGDLKLNWTSGCVAVTDHAIAQLAPLLRRGTPVEIGP